MVIGDIDVCPPSYSFLEPVVKVLATGSLSAGPLSRKAIDCMVGPIKPLAYDDASLSERYRSSVSGCSLCSSLCDCLKATSSFCCQSSAGSTVLSSSYRRRSFSVAGLATWNSLPRHLRDPVHTTQVFGRLLEIFFFSEY